MGHALNPASHDTGENLENKNLDTVWFLKRHSYQVFEEGFGLDGDSDACRCTLASRPAVASSVVSGDSADYNDIGYADAICSSS